MASGTQGNVMVGIYIPAFSYPAALSFQAIANAALDDFGLKEDVCEFFRTDSDSRIACIIKNTRFSLQAIEQTYKHNQSLADQLARAADALVAFQEKIEADELIIDNLKAQLLAMKSEENDEGVWKAKYEEESTLRQALQEKLEQLKHVVNSDTILEHTEHNNKPKIPIPRLQLSTMNGIPQLAMNGIGGGRGGEGRGEDTHIDSSKSAHEPKNVLSTTSPREQFRNGPVVTSPREQFRNGPSVTSPRDLHRGGSTRDTHPTTSREGLVSPRDAYAYAVAAAAAAPNGKRSSIEMALSMTSPRKHPNGIGSIPNGIVDASVRNTNSPRASVAAKAHSRRHSSNMDESVPMRRLSANSGELPMTPRASASPSPRSKSSGEIPPDYFDYGGHPFPIDVHSIMPVVHSFSYNAIDSPVASKRRSTISNLKSSRSEMDFTADVLSQCRLCNCDTFRVAGQADWICVCGHTSIKHSVNLLKASPSPSPTASPRKFG